MSEMYFLLLFILILFYVQVEAKNSCNDDCLTKTYCISSDGSGVCSKNNLVTAQFKGIPVFGQYDYLQLTFKGYNIAPDDEKTIKMSFDRPNYPSNEYSCYKSSLGATNAKFSRGSNTYFTGSSYYVDGVLYCTWIFNLYDDMWPQYDSIPADMIADSSQSISLYHDSQKIQVAEDTSKLPIYHLQYLKCCNKVHGNDQLVFKFDQIDKQIRYQLYYFQNPGLTVISTFTRKDGIKLQIYNYCYATAVGYIINGTEQVSITKQLINPSILQIEIFSWSTPFVLGDSTLSIDASTSVFDLEVIVGGVTIYAEKDVTLKNSSFMFKSSFILIIFTVLFQFKYSN